MASVGREGEEAALGSVMRGWWGPVAVALVKRSGWEAGAVVAVEEEGDRQLERGRRRSGN